MAKTFGGGYAEGLFNAAGYAIPELFGFKPPPEQQLWEAEHPYASFAASLAVDAIPYAGWFSATKKLNSLRKFDTFVEAIGNANKAPFLTGAARTAVRFAPFEAARVGVNAIAGDTPNSEMLSSALTNTLVGGFLGGTGEWLMSGGLRPKKVASFSKLDDTKPIQLQLRALDDHIAGGQVPADSLPKLQNYRSQMAVLARAQELSAKDDLYVGALEHGHDSKDINRLFDSREKILPSGQQIRSKTLLRKRFVGNSTRDFPTDEAWQQTAQRAELPQDFEKYAQFPRYIAFTGKKGNGAATHIDNAIGKNMIRVEDNWFMTREKNDGMYVLAKKITGTPGTATPLDEWVVLKTDKPEKFITKAADWAGVNDVRMDAFEPTSKALQADLGDIGNAIKRYSDSMPLVNYMAAATSHGRGLQGLERLKKLFGIGSGDSELEAVARLREWVRDYVTPGMFQFGRSPRAARVLSIIRQAMDTAEGMSDRALYGKYQRPQSAGNLLLESVRGRPELNLTGSLKELFDAAQHNPRFNDAMHRLWLNEAKNEDILAAYANGHLDDAGLKFVQTLKQFNDDQVLNMQKAQKATDSPVMLQREGHFGITRQYEGDQMIPLMDQGGTVRAIASGYNTRHAQRVAKELLSGNPTWVEGKPFDRSQVAGMPKEIRTAVATPGFVHSRGRVLGFKYSTKPWTKDELWKEIEDSVRYRNAYQAEMTSREVVRQELDKLTLEDVSLANAVRTRMNDLYGVQRPVAKMINTTVDRVLGPMLGQNSASKIASTSNNLLWHFDLGGMRIGYIVTQALSPIQTVLPEIAYVLNGTPESLAKYYDVFAAGGSKGAAGTISVLSPLRVMRQAMKEMRRPDDSLWKTFEASINERVVTPRLIEEFMGESSAKIRDMRGAVSSGQGFVDWMRAVSEFLPASAERFSRAYSLTVGHIIGRDFLKLQDEALYKFAKQFVFKTNFLYAAADRSGMFTGPVGSVLGQFKNWMMHYMYSMMEYTGEGFAKGNWSPLLWQQAGTWAVGGLAASPLINAATAVNGMFSDKTLLENTYDQFGTRMADGAFYGLPALLAGVSLSSQTSTPLANPTRDAEMLFSFVLMDRLKNMGSAFGAAVDMWQATGEHPAKSAQFRDLMVRAFAPKSIYRIMQVAQDEHINSLNTGYPVFKNVGMFDKLLYAVGVPPAEIERSYAISDVLWKEKQARIAEVQRLGEMYFLATQKGDQAGANIILRKAQMLGIASNVLQSAQSRLAKSRQDSIERNFGADAVLRFHRLLLD